MVMKEILQIRLLEEHYKAMLTQYHFRQMDLEQLKCLGDILLRAIEPVMYYLPCRITDVEDKAAATQTLGADEKGIDGKAAEKKVKNAKRTEPETVSADQVKKGTQLAVIVSLGAKVDALQNEYIRKERLTEGYMIECIGMELLKIAYEQAAEKIWERFGLWIGAFEFLGERYPLELTEDVFRLLVPEEISYNQAYMLTPKKTVVFMTTLKQERKDGYCHICDACSNLQCPNRQNAEETKEPEKRTGHSIGFAKAKQNQSVNLNYGYQRIFGKP